MQVLKKVVGTYVCICASLSGLFSIKASLTKIVTLVQMYNTVF